MPTDRKRPACRGWVVGAVGRSCALLLAAGAACAQGPEALARRPSPAGGIALVDVTVFPSPAEPAIRDAVILVSGDRIVRVGTRAGVAVPRGYRIVRLPGTSVTAGFWNSHVHLTRRNFLLGREATEAQIQAELESDFTRWGFTTVFDLASTMTVSGAVKDRLSRGAVQGPRILSVGDPFYPPGATPIYARPLYEAYGLPSAEISSPAQGAVRVSQQIAEGADGVKLFTGSIVGGPEAVVHMEPAAVVALVAPAHRGARPRPVFAHPTDRAGLEVAVNGGVDVLAHSAPLMGPWSTAYARWIVSRRVALVPTLALFEEAANPATPVATAQQQTRVFAEAGGTVLFGTDAGFTDAFDTSAEMRLMERTLGWRGLLASLTTAPSRTFGEGGRRGRVAAGLSADLVVLGGDPSVEVRAFSEVRMVIRAGRIVYARP